MGVDLAAEPAGTALAILEWSHGSAEVVTVETGVTDEDICDQIVGVAKIGIDCALGWPKEFVEFVTRYSQSDSATWSFSGDIQWRRSVAYRETDRVVRQKTGKWPLSVATDRLGLTAMRAAGLLSRLSETGVTIDRTGAGMVAEVYPGASLRRWGFDTSGYRTSPEIRQELISHIQTIHSWLNLNTFSSLMRDSADAFDAVIAGCAARAAALNKYDLPSPSIYQLAQQEGWIVLPEGSFDSLVE